MTDITIADFKAWKEDKVTQAFMAIVYNRIKDASEYLSHTAGMDKDADNYFRGFIAGQREVLEVSFEEEVDNG